MEVTLVNVDLLGKFDPKLITIATNTVNVVDDTQLEINFDTAIEKEKELVDKNKTKNKYENLTKNELIKLLIEKDKETEEGKNNKAKLDGLRKHYNALENKFCKQYNTINYLIRLYNGTRKACAKWKNEAISYQHQLATYKMFDDLL